MDRELDASVRRGMLRRRVAWAGGSLALGVAILLLLAAQVTLGLFAVDIDGLESGPLSHLVDFDTGRRLEHPGPAPHLRDAQQQVGCFGAAVQALHFAQDTP